MEGITSTLGSPVHGTGGPSSLMGVPSDPYHEPEPLPLCKPPIPVRRGTRILARTRGEKRIRGEDRDHSARHLPPDRGREPPTRGRCHAGPVPRRRQQEAGQPGRGEAEDQLVGMPRRSGDHDHYDEIFRALMRQAKWSLSRYWRAMAASCPLRWERTTRE